MVATAESLASVAPFADADETQRPQNVTRIYDSFHVLPHPLSRSQQPNGIAEGRHAIILNVFTEPEWRHQGIALLLLERIIDWARAERLDCLLLHASEAGRPLYERLGLVGTTEMRLARE